MPDLTGFSQALFNNAKRNAMIIMSKRGNIIQINAAFTNAFGYTNEDLTSKNFRVLFNKEDQVCQKPEIELNITLREGSSDDEKLVRMTGKIAFELR